MEVTPRPAAVPRWLQAADIATVLLTAAGLSILLFGGFRFSIAGVVISAHSALRLLLAAALVAAARHYFGPSPPLVSRAAATMRRFLSAESVRAIGPAFIWSRVGVLVTAYFAVISVGYPANIGFRASENELLNLPARWDAGWYLGIARDGYVYDRRSRGQQNVAFFPAFPMAMRAAGVFLGGHVDRGRARYDSGARMLWAGVIVSLAALAAALGYLYRMVRTFAGPGAAVAAAQFALAYPVAFIFNAPYTEALFLLASIATFYHFGRSQRGAAALWGVVAGLTRPNGFILAVPMFAIAVARSAPFPRLARVLDRLGAPAAARRPVADLAVSLAPVVGMLIFSAFLYGKWGDPFLWAKLHAAWGRTFQGLDPARESVDEMVRLGILEYTALAGIETIHVLAFLVAVGLSVPIAWRLGLAYTMLIVLMLLPPLLAGGWLSMSRLTVVLFPIYVYLAVVVPPAHRGPLSIALAILQGLGTVLFFTWRPFY